MNKSIIIATVAVVLLAGASSYFFLYTKAPEATSVQTEEVVVPVATSTAATSSPSTKGSLVAPETIPTTTEPGFTAAEVALHANATSCYSIIGGGVYNLTSWIGKHPGGEQAILSICGKDGTEAFLNQHKGGQRQADILMTYRIGALVK